MTVTPEIVGTIFDAGQRVVSWIMGIVADRQKSVEQVKREALEVAEALAASALSIRARIVADDAAALREFAESGRSMGTPTPRMVPAVRADLQPERATCPACEHYQHDPDCCGGIVPDGTRCRCSAGG